MDILYREQCDNSLGSVTAGLCICTKILKSHTGDVMVCLYNKFVDQGNQTSNLSITRHWLYPWATAITYLMWLTRPLMLHTFPCQVHHLRNFLTQTKNESLLSLVTSGTQMPVSCGLHWNITAVTGWIAIEFCTLVMVLRRCIKTPLVIVSLTFPPVPPWCLYAVLFKNVLTSIWGISTNFGAHFHIPWKMN